MPLFIRMQDYYCFDSIRTRRFYFVSGRTYLSRKSLSTTAEMSNKGFPIPKSELGLEQKQNVN